MTASKTIDVEVYDYVVSSTIIPPEKDQYDYGEALTYDTVKDGYIILNYKSGATEKVNLKESMISNFESTRIGEQTLTVKYSFDYKLSDNTTIPDSITTTFQVEVVDNIKGIEMNVNPKTEYKYGEELDISKGKITVKKGSGNETIDLSEATVTEKNGDPFNSKQIGKRSYLYV